MPERKRLKLRPAALVWTLDVYSRLHQTERDGLRFTLSYGRYPSDRWPAWLTVRKASDDEHLEDVRVQQIDEQREQIDEMVRTWNFEHWRQREEKKVLLEVDRALDAHRVAMERLNHVRALRV